MQLLSVGELDCFKLLHRNQKQKYNFIFIFELVIFYQLLFVCNLYLLYFNMCLFMWKVYVLSLPFSICILKFLLQSILTTYPNYFDLITRHCFIDVQLLQKLYKFLLYCSMHNCLGKVWILISSLILLLNNKRNCFNIDNLLSGYMLFFVYFLLIPNSCTNLWGTCAIWWNAHNV